MALALGGAGALLKAFIPALVGLTAHSRIAAGKKETAWRDTAAWAAAAFRPPIVALSPEAEAALAPLGLPPDGPFDPNATPRARLTPDVAARNFLCWARALGLAGDYSTRSVYALYCEFSEVDGRPPVRDIRFLEALAQAEGIATIARGRGKACRFWRWTIEPAKMAEAAEAIAADMRPPEPAPAPCRVQEATTPAMPQIAASPSPSARPARAPIVLSRFVADTEHPFSPAGLREREKHARRLRLNAAVSRKQRGALRRAA